jgi:hypothetical protein
MGKKFFTDDRRDFLLSFVDQHKSHKKNGTVEDFWHIIIPAYITKFPNDDVVITRPRERPKTPSGKPSKRRTPDEPKPLREVCPLVNVLRVTV